MENDKKSFWEKCKSFFKKVVKYVKNTLTSLHWFFFVCLKKDIQIFWNQIKNDPQQVWGNFLSFIKENIIIIALVLIYVFTYQFWENWIEKHIVNHLFLDFKSNLLYDIIVIVAAIICLNQIKNRNAIITKGRTVLICFIAVVTWVYYRWCSNSFDLAPLFICKYLCYFDIVLVLAICKLILFCIWKYKSSIEIKDINFHATRGFVRDVPINEIEKDSLERDEFAKTAIKKLINTNTNDGSFTYGIDAPWGSGKTSVMNLMRIHLESDRNKKIIIFFNPWLYAAEKDLVTAFFDELSKTLKRYDRSLANNLIDYSRLLSAFGTTETKMISSLFELTQSDDSSLQEQKQLISEAIKRIKRRIFVFIDDLDRLNADEIMEMMKLIRNVSDFPYMYIIAAYDKSHVITCLNIKMKSGATNFVEKIFEHEDILNPCSNESLRRSLVDKLKSSPSRARISELEDYIMNHDNKPLDALSNLREVYRLSNRFTSTVSLTGTRIHYIDLLLLELFKTKYPIAFSLFEHRWHEILVPDANHQYYRFFQGLDYENHFDFIKYLENHQEEMYLNKFDIGTIKMILSELFTQKDNEETNRHRMNYRRHRRINHIIWFNLYINLMQLKSDITENEFNKVMIKPIDEIKKQFSVWLPNKSVSLNHRLENYNKNNKLDRELLLKYIQGYIFISSIPPLRPRWNSFDVTFEMISQLKKFNNNHEYSEEDRTFILNLLEGSGYSHYISSYVGYLYKEKKYTDISFDNIAHLVPL